MILRGETTWQGKGRAPPIVIVGVAFNLGRKGGGE